MPFEKERRHTGRGLVECEAESRGATAPDHGRAATSPETPALTLKPPLEKDVRTYWQLVTDEAMRTNATFQDAHADVDEFTDGATATGRLLWVAWSRGKTKFEPTPHAPEGELVRQMELVYRAHRHWVRVELRTDLIEALAEANRMAAAAIGVSG